MYFDTHCHLLLIEERDINLKDIIKRALNNKVKHLLDVSVGLDDFFKRLSKIEELNKTFNINIYLSAGIPPYYADKRKNDDIQELDYQIKQSNLIVAVGEIGLDYYYNYGTHNDQIKLFIEQINIANKNGLPIIVHTRDADEDLIDVLTKNKVEKGGVIHCFSSDINTANILVKLGFYISFAGNVTYKKSTNIQETAKLLRSDRILIETDSPYLSPQKYRGKTNEPSYITETAKYISLLRGITTDNLAEQTFKNAQNLFNIKDTNP